MPQESILVVDDEPGVRSMLEVILKDEGYAVAAVGTGEAGLAAARDRGFDAMLLDVWLPGIDGIETLQRLKRDGVDAEIVMISGHGTIDTAVKATKLGAFDFVEKPLSLEKTLLVLRNALKQRRLEKRNRVLLGRLTSDTEILGHSEASQRMRRESEAAAGTDAPVLIHGEAGSGRETIARHVHNAGRRAGEAFVHVPCVTLTAENGGRILFGYSGEPGRLDLAAGGTLFLDEVDAMPPELQDALGAWLAAHPDVRPIASSGSDPSTIRPGLRERLDVLRIAAAPLRDRREDIDLLASRFMRDLAREYGRSEKRFSADAMAALTSHDWPGNIRGLRNVVERSLLLAPAPEISAADLPAELGGGNAPAEDLYARFATLEAGRAAFERYFLSRAVREEKGDLASAAARVGVSIEELRRLLG